MTEKERDYITIVSGTARSGTSLGMQMLVAGGMECLLSDHLMPDGDNPNGYFEYLPVVEMEEKGTDWVKDCVGKCVKVFASSVPLLPKEYKYRILFFTRDADEVVASEKRMFIRGGVDPTEINAQNNTDNLKNALQYIFHWGQQTEDAVMMRVDYNELVADPLNQLTVISGYLSGLDIDAMTAVIEPRLHRNVVRGEAGEMPPKGPRTERVVLEREPEWYEEQMAAVDEELKHAREARKDDGQPEDDA